MSLLEYRIQHFQNLINKGRYYRIMNWNLSLIRKCFRKGNGKFLKPTKWNIVQHKEDYCLF